MPQVRKVYTDNPLPVALSNMGRAATQAADTFTVQEWAARLATKAPPRDYVAQLRELYLGILDRWRYTMEPGERVPGTAAAVLNYTLGAKYNRGPSCPTAERCDIERTQWKERGWGDCDDVSTLTAAGVLALGMVPAWRVVQWPNGAHVSVLARTPQGQLVSVDPVGHPKEPFGWAMEPPGSTVLVFDLHGRPMNRPTTRGAQPMGTYLAGIEQHTAKQSTRPHIVALHPLSPRGPRMLAIPQSVHRSMLLGGVVDRSPAVDQYGQRYEYMAGADVWAPLDGRRSRRRARRRARRTKRKTARIVRRTKRRKKIKRGLRRMRQGIARAAGKISRSRVFKFLRKIKAKIMSSKLVQGLASQAMALFGVPPAATKAILQREADLAKRGGRSRLIELVASGKLKEAGKMMASGLKAAGKGAIKEGLAKLKAMVPMGGTDDEAEGISTYCTQNGQTFGAAYVAGFYPAENMLGEVDTMQIATTATPGAWYQVKKGDTLIGIAGKAYGLGSGGARLRAAQRINAAPYNGRFFQDSKGSFNQKYFAAGIVGLLPRFPAPDVQRLDEQDGGEFDGGQYPALWIPSEAQPDAPPMAIDEPEIVDPEPAEPEDEPEIPEPTPQRPAPPEDCTGGGKFPGFEPVWTDAFWDVNMSPPGMNPGGWSCRPGSGPAPQPQPQPEPEPSPEEPYTPPVIPSQPQPIPGGRTPLCPPGQEAYWPSGEDGFGPHACRDPGFVPSQPEPEPSPEEPPIEDPIISIIVPMEPEPEPAPPPYQGGGMQDLRAPFAAMVLAWIGSRY